MRSSGNSGSKCFPVDRIQIVQTPRFVVTRESKKMLPPSGTPEEASSCGLMEKAQSKRTPGCTSLESQVESKEDFLEGAGAKLVVLDSSKQESLAAERTRYRGMIDRKAPNHELERQSRLVRETQ